MITAFFHVRNKIKIEPTQARRPRHTRLKADLAELRANLGSELAGVRTDVAKLETRLIRWLVGVVLGAATLSVAVVAALLRFWLAGG